MQIKFNQINQVKLKIMIKFINKKIIKNYLKINPNPNIIIKKKIINKRI
jgi:hypothetical protein